MQNFQKYPELYDETVNNKLFNVNDEKVMKFNKNLQKLGEHIVTKTIMGGVMGGGMGCFFGLLGGGLMTGNITNETLVSQSLNASKFYKQMFSGVGAKMYSMSKTFAFFSLYFGGIQGVVEKVRGKHDKLNNLYAGCITGFLMGVRTGGIAGGASGCLGFAAFGLVMDFVFDR